MRWLMLGIGLVLTFAQQAVADPAALQGEWTATKALRDGKAADDLAGHRLSFSETSFRIQSDAGALLYSGTIVLHPDTNPRAIDFQHNEGNLKGRDWKGIYALDGDTLIVCDNAPDLERGRPAAFEALKGSGYVLITFTRAKP
jgi:uncharacterized protein (TIGR03067 family)